MSDGGGRNISLRKACDLCTRRKRACDGKKPCALCRELGVAHTCVYSARQKSGRKKKPRTEIDGILHYDETGARGILGLHPPGAGGYGAGAYGGFSSGHPAGGPAFGASGATGLVGTMESFFLATYLRDFNRFVPLTSDSVVTQSMLEVLSPAVAVAFPDPFQKAGNASSQLELTSRRHARLAVFWGVVALGARIVGAPDAGMQRYLQLMRVSLKECFDSGDREVVQAYLLLSTLESMQGHHAKARRYLNFASTMYSGLKAAEKESREQEEIAAGGIGIGGKPAGCDKKSDGCEDEPMEVVISMYQHKMKEPMLEAKECAESKILLEVGSNRPNDLAAVGSSSAGTGSGSASTSSGGDGGASSATDATPCGGSPGSGPGAGSGDGGICPIQQRFNEHRSRPMDALRLLICTTVSTRTALDPRSSCPKVRAALAKADYMLESAHQVVMRSSLAECIASLVPVRIWSGVTRCMRGDRESGVATIEAAVELALTRPGLMTFPLWWHAVHCAAVVLAHCGRREAYEKLRVAYNVVTFGGTELPPLADFHAEAVCLEGSHCRALAHWLNRTQPSHYKEEDCGAEGAAFAAAAVSADGGDEGEAGFAGTEDGGAVQSFATDTFTATLSAAEEEAAMADTVPLAPAALVGADSEASDSISGGVDAGACVGSGDSNGVMAMMTSEDTAIGRGSSMGLMRLGSFGSIVAGDGGDGGIGTGVLSRTSSLNGAMPMEDGDIAQLLRGDSMGSFGVAGSGGGVGDSNIDGGGIGGMGMVGMGELDSFGSLGQEAMDALQAELGALGAFNEPSAELQMSGEIPKGSFLVGAEAPHQLQARALQQELAVAETVAGAVVPLPSSPSSQQPRQRLLPPLPSAGSGSGPVPMPLAARLSERKKDSFVKPPGTAPVLAGGSDAHPMWR
ncbi:unnamed protein product [Phaeothamnion confervicola]